MPLAFKNIRSITSILLAGIILLIESAPARAQPYPVPPTWGGDFSTRPRLTGDWGGVRDELGAKGVVIDVDLTEIGRAHV